MTVCRPASKLRAALLALAAVVLLAVPAFADGNWKPLPWHLVDYNHRLPETGPFRTLEIDMELSGDAEGGPPLYLSPLWGHIGKSGFYFGFLSDIFDLRQQKAVGKGIIFSRWGLGSEDDIRMPDGAWNYVGRKASSGEGDFLSVRRTYAWKPGKYTFLLRARTRAADSDGTWVDLLIFEHATGTWIDGGGLRFTDPTPHLSQRVVSFVEVVQRRGEPRTAMPDPLPKLDIVIGPPLVNGTFEPLANRTQFSDRVPRILGVRTEAGVIHMEMGRIPVPANDNEAPAKAGKAAAQ